MKKIIKTILISMIVLLTMLSIQVFAAEESLTFDIELTAPEAGIYGEGQEVTITVTFNNKIKGIMPKYAIYFGTDSSKTIELETEEIAEFTNKVDYTYTIKSGDNGELRAEGFVNPTEYIIEDEEGAQFHVTGGSVYRFEKTILADTTIQWTDFSNATVEMKTDDEGCNSFFYVQLGNCTLNSDNMYYAHLSHSENEDIVLKDKNDVNNQEFWQTMINTDNGEVYTNGELKNLFAEVGDVYITICEIDNDTNVPKIVLKSKKITELPTLPLTQRLTGYFFDDYTSTFCWEVYSENQKNLNYKIGKVTDLNLLKLLKNGDASALPNLLEYAKNAESIGTGTVELGEDATITDRLNLVDDEYYYVYLELETIDGKYVLIEDVSLYQSLVSDDGGKNLLSMTDKEFKWNLDETDNTPEKDTTTAEGEIPKAGLEKTIILFVIVIAIALVITSKKCKKYRDII